MKNPRETFGDIVRTQLGVLEESQNAFSLRIAKRLGITTKFSGYVNNVIQGKKVPPVEDRGKWAEALHLHGQARRDFEIAHDAALAWGKADGRAHQEAQQRKIRELERLVAAQEQEIARLKARLAASITRR